MASRCSLSEFYLLCFYGVSTPSTIPDSFPLDLDFRRELSIRQAKETLRMLDTVKKVRKEHESATKQDRLTD
jgi:hypothetical protein